MNLYAITEEMRALLDGCEGGEVDDTLYERLDRLEGEFAHKAEQLLKAVRNFKASAAAKKEEAQWLEFSAAADTRQAERLEAYLKSRLELLGVAKLDTKLFKVRIQRNGQPSVRYEGDLESLERTWVKVTTKLALNRDAVVEAVKAGQPLPPGVVVEHGTHLRIS